MFQRVKDNLIRGALGGGYIWGSATITSAGRYMSFGLLVVGVCLVARAVVDLMKPGDTEDSRNEPEER